MKIIDVNKDNFESVVLSSKNPVLADFNAEWCGPCRMLKPILEELSEERADCQIVSINIDNNESLAERYDVYSIPCLVLFKDGKEVSRSVGLKSKDELEELIGD